MSCKSTGLPSEILGCISDICHFINGDDSFILMIQNESDIYTLKLTEINFSHGKFDVPPKSKLKPNESCSCVITEKNGSSSWLNKIFHSSDENDKCKLHIMYEVNEDNRLRYYLIISVNIEDGKKAKDNNTDKVGVFQYSIKLYNYTRFLEQTSGCRNIKQDSIDFKSCIDKCIDSSNKNDFWDDWDLSMNKSEKDNIRAITITGETNNKFWILFSIIDIDPLPGAHSYT